MKRTPTTIEVKQSKAVVNASISEDGSFHLDFYSQDIASAREMLDMLERFFEGDGIG